jgi:glutamate synthase domain-containing protein 2
MNMRKQFFIGSVLGLVIIVLGYLILPLIYYPLHHIVSLILMLLILVGFYDAFQTSQTIKRNFPILGRFRYMLESIRPEIQQYFIERNTDGTPFSREQRSIVYQRAKGELDSVPFGTQLDVYQAGYEWVNHSLAAKHIDPKSLRVIIGGKNCLKPYSASLLNISAMSYGALSKEAIMALNGGAHDGGFAHNTGEGGLSPHHLKNGGDLIWQIGTGYFGCRDKEGKFSEEKFQERAILDQVKMIEIKLSQGAKPGHGGILPKEKITQEIAQIREVGMDKDVLSPPTHSAFSSPIELMLFIKRLRDLSGGKPVGFKLCLGKRREFVALCKAMLETGITPDFITVDGGEGGTGAAPLEFTNHVGTPGIDGLIFVHNCLQGFNLRKEIKIISSGKVTTGFAMIKRIALGADLLYSARAMMLALGCIQALRCNSNICPAGIATQDPNLTAGLVVPEKRKRVAMYHKNTMHSCAEILGAMGLESTSELRPWHILTKISPFDNRNYYELFDFVKEGDFLNGKIPATYQDSYLNSSADTFINKREMHL